MAIASEFHFVFTTFDVDVAVINQMSSPIKWINDKLFWVASVSTPSQMNAFVQKRNHNNGTMALFSEHSFPRRFQRIDPVAVWVCDCEWSTTSSCAQNIFFLFFYGIWHLQQQHLLIWIVVNDWCYLKIQIDFKSILRLDRIGNVNRIRKILQFHNGNDAWSEREWERNRENRG